MNKKCSLYTNIKKMDRERVGAGKMDKIVLNFNKVNHEKNTLRRSNHFLKVQWEIHFFFTFLNIDQK